MTWNPLRSTSIAPCLLLVLGGAARAQPTPPTAEMEQAYRSFLQGEGEGFEAFTRAPEEARTFLLRKLDSRRPYRRVVALDLLDQLERHQHGAIATAAVAAAVRGVLADPEEDGEVVDMALRIAEHVAPRLADPLWKEVLFHHLAKGRARAARVLGVLGDGKDTARLEGFVASELPGVGRNARLALARLGVAAYRDEIVQRLHAGGRARIDAMLDLVYVRDARTVREIAVYLFDPGAAPAEGGDTRPIPYRLVAAHALAELVRDPPVRKSAGAYDDRDVERWRSWWREHREEYEK